MDNCPVCHKEASLHPQGLFCCPFCGEAATLVEFGDADSSYHTYAGQCLDDDDCCAISEPHFTAECATTAWNNRADGWVRCSERMPDLGKVVNIWFPRIDADSEHLNDQRRRGFLTADGELWYCSDGKRHPRDAASHWRELPDKPRELQ